MIFQGASIGKGLWFFKMVPEWLFQNSFETRVLLSFVEFCSFHLKNQKNSVNPMVWRCREFFFSKIFVFLMFFRPDFSNFVCSVIFLLRHRKVMTNHLKIIISLKTTLRWGDKNNILSLSLLVRFPGGVLKSQIRPERSTHSPTEVKETLN